MFNLIRNENMKIYSRLRTWVLLAILVGLVCLTAVIMHKMGGGFSSDWRQAVSADVEASRHALLNKQIPADSLQQVEDDVKLGEYRLAHNIPPVERTMWGAVQQLSKLVFIVTIFTVIVAGEIVAGEFSAGTIKLLLIRPASRTKILLSKYAASFLFSLLLLLILFATGLLVNLALYGGAGLNVPYLTVNAQGSVAEGSLLLHTLGVYGLGTVQLIMMVTLAFMISSVFRSSALAIGLSIFIMFVAPQATQLLALKYDWIKFTLFANTDLSQYLQGRPLVEGMTPAFSIIVLAAHFLLFNTLSWTIFRKRDVAA